MMSPYVQRFVMHIGEMGSRWGLNRTLGQMCGLKQLLHPRRKKDSTETTST